MFYTLKGVILCTFGYNTEKGIFAKRYISLGLLSVLTITIYFGVGLKLFVRSRV